MMSNVLTEQKLTNRKHLFIKQKWTITVPIQPKTDGLVSFW